MVGGMPSGDDPGIVVARARGNGDFADDAETAGYGAPESTLRSQRAGILWGRPLGTPMRPERPFPTNPGSLREEPSPRYAISGFFRKIRVIVLPHGLRRGDP
jgi:hypothetical protein